MERISKIVLLLIVLVYLFSLFLPLTSVQEARRAEIVQEAVKYDHWLIPTLNGEPYVTKPPLHPWVTGGLTEILGLNEAVLRLPSLLAAAGILFLIFRLAQRAGGNLSALLTVIFLLAAPRFFFFSHRVEIEMLLAFFFILFLYFAWGYLESGTPRDLYGAFGALAGGLLTKGPFIFLALVPVILYGFFRKEERCLKFLLNPTGWLFALTPAFLWYLYVYHHLGAGSFEELLREDLMGRLAGQHRDPFYHYAGALFLGFLPESLLLLYRPLDFLKRYLRHSLNIFLFLSWLGPLLVLSLTSQKFSKYLLSLYPFFAYFLADRTKELVSARYQLPTRTILPLFALLIIVGALTVEIWGNSLRFESVEKIKPYLRKPMPYYFWKKFNPLVVFYHGEPIPAIHGKIIPQGILLEEASKCQSKLKNYNQLKLLGMIAPFYRKDRCLYIYFSGDTSSEVSSSSGK